MVNRQILIGRLGANPDLRYTPSEKPVCNLRMATSRKWKDKEGAKQEKTEWHNVVVFGGAGESVGRYLKKGSLVYVEGRTEHKSWESEGKTFYRTEVIADDVQFLDPPPQPETSDQHETADQ